MIAITEALLFAVFIMLAASNMMITSFVAINRTPTIGCPEVTICQDERQGLLVCNCKVKANQKSLKRFIWYGP
jgi:hypothetical protein